MGETVSSDTGREAGESARLAWIDRSPLTLCLGSLAIAVVAGLVQVSFGSYSMSVERVRFALSGVAVVAAAASIAVAGIVGFVGLIVPHVVRNVVGSDYKRLVVGCLFAGPALLVAADVGARLAIPVLVGGSGQLPVGIVTGLVGGPYFLYLMRKQDQLGEI